MSVSTPRATIANARLHLCGAKPRQPLLRARCCAPRQFQTFRFLRKSRYEDADVWLYKKKGGQRAALFSVRSFCRRLEGYLADDLRNPLVRRSSRKRSIRRRRRRLCDDGLPENTRVRIRIRSAIVSVIEPVECVEAQLEIHSLGDWERLPDAHVTAQEARTAEGVATHCSCKVGGGRKGIRGARSKASRCNTLADIAEISLGEVWLKKDGRARQIVSSQASLLCSVNRAERKARAVEQSARELPPADRLIQQAMLALEWQLIDVAPRQLMPRVVIGGGIVGLEVEGIDL
jgi:hypothetical protein